MEIPETPSVELQFLAELPAIDRIAGALCRRRGLTGADAEDFSAHVRSRFVVTEYAALARFRGESSLPVFLTTVIARLLKDYLVARDGRWRPSAAAMRAGPVAVLLERHISRQGCSADEAVTRVMHGGGHPYSERELRAIVRTLRAREPMRPREVTTDRPVEFGPMSTVSADAIVEELEQDAERQRAHDALDGALRALPPEDRLLVSMRFLDGQSIADIARALRTEQKPLYRRLERALVSLRRVLEAHGVTRDTVRSIMEEGGAT